MSNLARSRRGARIALTTEKTITLPFLTRVSYAEALARPALCLSPDGENSRLLLDRNPLVSARNRCDGFGLQRNLQCGPQRLALRRVRQGLRDPHHRQGWPRGWARLYWAPGTATAADTGSRRRGRHEQVEPRHHWN